MENSNMKQTLTKFLLKHKDKHPVSFHMPGHKGSAIYREHGYGEFLDNIMDGSGGLSRKYGFQLCRTICG